MCWNKEISANTFVFSTFVLLMIIYNNTYTQYKLPGMNPWVYIFFFSVILMQLIEYFIWLNIHHTYYNYLFSFFARLLLLLQPIASSMLINNTRIRQITQITYLLITVPVFIYIVFTRNIYSSVSPKKHLIWHFWKNKYESMLGSFIWLVFFLFPLFYSGYYIGLLFGGITLLGCLLLYAKDGTFGSMWCWIVNSIFIYYAIYLLLYLPLRDKIKNPFCFPILNDGFS
jgi:hypothetical protein